METLFIYIAKSAGLLLLFYCAYYFLLRKETFFNSNRYFLLAGLLTSVVLPFIVYTKIIWVDPTPMPDFNLANTFSQPLEKESFEINWLYVFLGIYSIGLLALLIKFGMDFYKLNLVLKGKKIQQQADFKFIDVNENIAPFSYFDYIVYNSSLYTALELENIIEHEKVHSDQNHTVDVLISRIFCILFWFNPISWLYKKAITQNLEFIADREAAKILSDKKAYQYTLLKITTHENCVAITNHFYQSLIKKRIIMLNKNQSKKRNSWKYYTVIPALAAFVFLFQVEVIAHEKPLIENAKSNNENVDIFKITKTTTDEELNEKKKTLKEKYDITATFSNMERNSKNELISIKVELKKGTEIAQQMQIRGNEVIKTFGIIISTLENGKLNIDFKTDETVISDKKDSPLNNPALQGEREIFINGEKATEEELAKLDPNEIEQVDVVNKSGKKTLLITKRTNKLVKVTDKEVYINGVKANEKQLSDLDQSTIDKMDVNTNDNTVRITTKTVTNTNNSTNVHISTVVNQEEKPLIIIDGKRAEPNVNINTIPSYNVVSVNVIKGKAAENKYGSDAKDGVVEITTKGAKSNKGNEVVGISVDKKKKVKSFNDQLIIIDGKKSSITDTDELNKLDIEKMEVWKGIEAVTKYGDEGKNGVIVITTRK